MSKIIPARVIENCHECDYIKDESPFGCNHPHGPSFGIAWATTESSLIYEGIHPACPLADAVSDPCYLRKGISCKSIGDDCHRRDVLGLTWATCKNGKEWKGDGR